MPSSGQRPKGPGPPAASASHAGEAHRPAGSGGSFAGSATRTGTFAGLSAKFGYTFRATSTR